MATKTVVTISQTDPVDPTWTSTLDARTGIERVRSQLEHAILGTRTISSVAVRDTAVAASATLTLASVAANTVILVNGVPFTAITGTVVAGNDEFDIDGDDTADAASLAAAINASTTTGISGVISATSALGVVTITALQPGRSGNAITIENLGIVATGTATCSAVDAADAITINGQAITAHATVAANNQFVVAATDAATATNLAACINGSTTAIVSKHVRALARAAVVHIFSRYGGTAGNCITLTTTDVTDLAVSGARLTGGTITQHEGVQASGTIICAAAAAADTVTINGVVFTAHATTEAANQWEVSGTDTADAASLVKAINNSTTALAQEVIASNVAGVVTVTARRGGHLGNAVTLASSNGTRLAVSGARLTGGAVPTVSVVSGGLPMPTGGGARLASGSNDSAITYTL